MATATSPLQSTPALGTATGSPTLLPLRAGLLPLRPSPMSRIRGLSGNGGPTPPSSPTLPSAATGAGGVVGGAAVCPGPSSRAEWPSSPPSLHSSVARLSIRAAPIMDEEKLKKSLAPHTHTRTAHSPRSSSRCSQTDQRLPTRVCGERRYKTTMVRHSAQLCAPLRPATALSTGPTDSLALPRLVCAPPSLVLIDSPRNSARSAARRTAAVVCSSLLPAAVELILFLPPLRPLCRCVA